METDPHWVGLHTGIIHVQPPGQRDGFENIPLTGFPDLHGTIL
jgi:hypothetical protein